MQRLEIVYRSAPFLGSPPPLTDEAGYWEINVKSCDGERYYEALGFTADGEHISEHVVAFNLVRSVSARPIQPEPGTTVTVVQGGKPTATDIAEVAEAIAFNARTGR